MSKRIFWKKGMRLTDEILNASDKCHFELLGYSLLLGAAGRSGLLPSSRQFGISLAINKNMVDIESLSCLALTKSGILIDIAYDSSFSNFFDTRVVIPDTEEKRLILVINASNDTICDLGNGLCQQAYSFSLVPENSVIDSNSFPIARIINEYGWRADELDFVPPCLFLSSHNEFKALAAKFSKLLNDTAYHLSLSVNSECKTAVGILWPFVQNLSIVMDKEIETMTPMALFGNVQKFVSMFVCACSLDPYLNLAEVESFNNYINLHYNYKEVYLRIKEGLSLSVTISEKIEKFKEFVKEDEVKLPAPTIAKENTFLKCTRHKIKIPLQNNCPGSKIYYTVDGSEPTLSSESGDVIAMASGFIGGRDKEEADRIITVKLKAFMNDQCSDTATYKIRLQKDVKHWIEI